MPQPNQSNVLQSQLVASIRETIREHLAQDGNQDSAINEASREIVAALLRPIVQGGDRTASQLQAADLDSESPALLSVRVTIEGGVCTDVAVKNADGKDVRFELDVVDYDDIDAEEYDRRRTEETNDA